MLQYLLMNPERIESMEFFRRSYVKSPVYLMIY